MPPQRRSFLGALLALGVSSVGALLATPLARFTLSPLWRSTGGRVWSDVGPVADLRPEAPMKVLVEVEQRDGWRKIVSTKPVYVIQAAGGGFRALSAVCPHLGCAVAWSESRQQFLSPCHGGVFDKGGGLISGPPRRGLDELETTVEDGRLKVRYQYFRPLVATREVIG